MNTKTLLFLLGLLFAALLLAGCGGGAAEPAAVAPTAAEPTTEPASDIPPTNIPATEALVPPTATPLPPTETPIPPTYTPAPTPTAPAILGPSPRIYSTMAYDSESDRIILVGGQVVLVPTGIDYGVPSDFNDETWAYEVAGNQWTRMSPFPPGPRGAIAMAYDAESDRVILFGGANHTGPELNDTWGYDYNTDTWEQLAAGPANHLGPRLAYDAESDRVILFGGWDFPIGSDQDDTWAYDYNSDTWTEMNPGTRPPGRNYQPLAYDAESDRVLLWGGGIFAAEPQPVWAYDYNTDSWEALPPLEGPIPADRPYLQWAYDAESDRTILFGAGPSEAGGGNQTWAYDYNTNTWTLMEPNPNPGERINGALVYNSIADRIIQFGGIDEGQLSAETWSYDFNSDTWEDLTTRE